MCILYFWSRSAGWGRGLRLWASDHCGNGRVNRQRLLWDRHDDWSRLGFAQDHWGNRQHQHYSFKVEI